MWIIIIIFIVYCRNCKGWPALMGVSLLWQPATVPPRMYLYCYYAALLPRRGPHIASHSVCLSVCPSVRPVIERHVAPPSELQWHTEGRISYGHLGRTNLFYLANKVSSSSSSSGYRKGHKSPTIKQQNNCKNQKIQRSKNYFKIFLMQLGLNQTITTT